MRYHRTDHKIFLVHCHCSVVGFISDLIKKLWGELEIADDSPVYTPKYWPINPIDKSAKKVRDMGLFLGPSTFCPKIFSSMFSCFAVV